MTNVFVYGTLKKGYPNHYLLNDPKNGVGKYVCSAITKEKYPLIVATEYAIPFLLNHPGIGHNIYGEVYSVDEKMKRKLDDLERVGILYDVVNIELKTDKEDLICGGYLINDFKNDLLDLPMIDNFTNDNEAYLPHKARKGTIIDVVKFVKKGPIVAK